MDEWKKQKLESAGIDVTEALERFLGREEMMMKFLLRFPQDPNLRQCREAMEQGDAAGAYRAAHTLKGVAGNLSMKILFQRAGELCDLLRKEDLAAAGEKMAALEEEYRRTIETLLCLESFCENA